MNNWIIKNFNLNIPDRRHQQISILMVKILLFSFPLTVIIGSGLVIQRNFLMGSITLAETLLFAVSLLLWRWQMDFAARIMLYFGMLLITGVQNLTFPANFCQEMLFPALISTSYVTFQKGESKLRLGGALFGIMIAVISDVARMYYEIPKLFEFSTIGAEYMRDLNIICVSSGIFYIFRHFVLSNEKQELEMREATRIGEASRLEVMRLQRISILGEIAGGVAHEVNNPLSIIKASSYNIATNVKKGADVQFVLKSITHIDDAVSRISKITWGLLQFTSQMQMNEEPDETDLVLIVQECALFFQKQMKNYSIELTLNVPVDTMIIRGTHSKITQIFFSLISNAIDAVIESHESWIAITVEPLADKVVVKFVDSGLGILPENADKIMQPFFTTKSFGKGAGLGLSLCEEICLNFGGKIELDRTAQHTTFRVSLEKRQENKHALLRAVA